MSITRYGLPTALGFYGDSLWSVGNAENYSRLGIGNSTASMGTGIAVFSHFTAPAANTITKLGMSVNSTANSGITLARIGLYTVTSALGFTLVARTANDTTIGATTDALNQSALNTTGGYPAAYTFIPGQRYAFAFLQVGTTTCTLEGRFAGGARSASPVVATAAFGQTDLATTYTSGSAGTNWYFQPYVAGIA